MRSLMVRFVRSRRQFRRSITLVLVLGLALSSCGLNSRGPWVDESGRRLQGTEMIEFDGFAACDQERVVFIRFFSDQYAKDPQGRLGELRSGSGEVPARPRHPGRQPGVWCDAAGSAFET